MRLFLYPRGCKRQSQYVFLCHCEDDRKILKQSARYPIPDKHQLLPLLLYFFNSLHWVAGAPPQEAEMISFPLLHKKKGKSFLLPPFQAKPIFLFEHIHIRELISGTHLVHGLHQLPHIIELLHQVINLLNRGS